MDITFSANNRQEVITFPYAPAGITIDSTQANKTYEGLSKNLNLIGNLALRTMSLEGMWPKKKQRWSSSKAAADPRQYISFFERWRKKLVPVRIVITSSDGTEFLNMACTVDKFSYGVNRAGDITYSIDITEYTFI